MPSFPDDFAYAKSSASKSIVGVIEELEAVDLPKESFAWAFEGMVAW
jgi:hypothetical protein